MSGDSAQIALPVGPEDGEGVFLNPGLTLREESRLLTASTQPFGSNLPAGALAACTIIPCPPQAALIIHFCWREALPGVGTSIQGCVRVSAEEPLESTLLRDSLPPSGDLSLHLSRT